VVLAAGAGTRLAPLTRLRPKALCPIGGVPLVDLAVARLGAAVDEVWVNVHHGRSQLEAHLAGLRAASGTPVAVSLEAERPLGTAGALGHLRDALYGRSVVVVNADGWTTEGVSALVEGWDRTRVRVLVPGGGDFGPRSAVAGAALPWAVVEQLADEVSGLYERCWAPAAAAGRLEVVPSTAPFVDCGTPTRYLQANMLASGGETVVGAGARVLGRAERCVLWEGVTVGANEHLTAAIRASDTCTVHVR
jgi:NDP-sugar pyrophosphorylase family protein